MSIKVGINGFGRIGRQIFKIGFGDPELDFVAVCLKRDDLDSFDPEMARPGDFHHNPGWREHERGEADHLVEEAYREIGGYPYGPRRRGGGRRLEDLILRYAGEAREWEEGGQYLQH